MEEEDRHVDCRGRGRMQRGKGLLILFGRLRRGRSPRRCPGLRKQGGGWGGTKMDS